MKLECLRDCCEQEFSLTQCCLMPIGNGEIGLTSLARTWTRSARVSSRPAGYLSSCIDNGPDYGNKAHDHGLYDQCIC
jgi:hypothetical protein